MSKNLNELIRDVMGAAALVAVTLLSPSAPAMTSNASAAMPASHTVPLLETGCCA